MYQSMWNSRRDEVIAAAHRVKNANPAAWEEMKVPGQKSRIFISLVAKECQRAIHSDIGCNLKRGGPEVSIDVLAMPNSTGCRDATGKFPGLELRDIVGNAEGPDAYITWGDATPATIASGQPGGWTKTATEAPAPPATYPSYEAMGGDEGGKKVTRLMEEDYKKAEKAGLDGNSGAWQWRTAYDFLTGKLKTLEESIAAHQPEWRDSLNKERMSNGKPPIAW